MWLLGDNQGGQPLPRYTGRFILRGGEGYRPDELSHEMITVLRDGRGLVVLSGCSHRGALPRKRNYRKLDSRPPRKIEIRVPWWAPTMASDLGA